MKTTLKQTVNFKSGLILHQGTPITVETAENDKKEKIPYLARITVDATGHCFTFKMQKIWKLSEEFIQPTNDLVEEAATDGACESMTGQRVEPDGYDEHGLPSILMALGYL